MSRSRRRESLVRLLPRQEPATAFRELLAAWDYQQQYSFKHHDTYGFAADMNDDAWGKALAALAVKPNILTGDGGVLSHPVNAGFFSGSGLYVVVFNALSNLPWEKQCVIVLTALPEVIKALQLQKEPTVLRVTNRAEVSVFCKTTDLKAFVERSRKNKR